MMLKIIKHTLNKMGFVLFKFFFKMLNKYSKSAENTKKNPCFYI